MWAQLAIRSERTIISKRLTGAQLRLLLVSAWNVGGTSNLKLPRETTDQRFVAAFARTWGGQNSGECSERTLFSAACLSPSEGFQITIPVTLRGIVNICECIGHLLLDCNSLRPGYHTQLFTVCENQWFPVPAAMSCGVGEEFRTCPSRMNVRLR